MDMAPGSAMPDGMLAVNVFYPEKVAQWVWDVMVLVAIHAMNQGRKELYHLEPILFALDPRYESRAKRIGSR